MLKGVYDIRIILGVPLAVFVCLVILVLTIGPILIRRAFQKKGLEAPSLANRFWRCFGAGCAAVVGSFGIMFFSAYIGGRVFGLISQLTATVLVILWFIVTAVGLVLLSARLCVPPAEDPNSPHPLGKRRVLSSGILIAACTAVFWVNCLSSLSRLRTLSMAAWYRANVNMIGKGLETYEVEHGDFPDHLGQLIDEGLGPMFFMLPNNWESIEAARERHEKGEPAKAPPDFYYIKLPKDAPDDLLWVWPDPKAFDGDRFNVLYFDTSVKVLMPHELPAEIKKTTDWLEKHQPTSKPSDF